MLDTVDRLLAVQVTDLEATLIQSCDLVSAALRADKVDIFLFNPSKDTLVALGSKRSHKVEHNARAALFRRESVRSST